MEEAVSESLNGTNNNSKGDLSESLESVSNPNNISSVGDEPDSCRLDKKAKLIPTPTSLIDTSSNQNNNVSDSYNMSSSIYSNDSKAANVSQSSRSRMSPESISAGDQNIFAESSEKDFANMAGGILDYGVSEHESQGPPASEIYHAKYRKSCPDLMTLHMFTGQFKGEKPRYIPVYKRNQFGKLMRLRRGGSGHWGYSEVTQLREDEIVGGLKILEEPKAETVLQSPEPKKTVGPRTLADFGLPEEKPEGGWGWL